MRLNYDTILVGDRCLLVPYRPEHVERYHAWMQEPELLQATGSEPLSLAQEYEMQKSWSNDDNKCTFIVLARDRLPEHCHKRIHEIMDETTPVLNEEFIQESLMAMVGDVNLFLSDEEQDDEEAEADTNQQENASRTPQHHTCTNNDKEEKKRFPQAELDIMVAEKDCRGNGMGREASCLMMVFGATHLSVRRFFCKINHDNRASLALFRNKLEFTQCDYAACFQQYELELKQVSPKDMIQKVSSLRGEHDYTGGLRTIRLVSSSTSS